MEKSKPLTSDQLNKLKADVRQRFDELYQRIGSNRASLSNKILSVDLALNKELTKEKIDEVRQKAILNKVREAEREASKQLPHIQKKSAPASKS